MRRRQGLTAAGQGEELAVFPLLDTRQDFEGSPRSVINVAAGDKPLALVRINELVERYLARRRNRMFDIPEREMFTGFADEVLFNPVEVGRAAGQEARSRDIAIIALIGEKFATVNSMKLVAIISISSFRKYKFFDGAGDDRSRSLENSKRVRTVRSTRPRAKLGPNIAV